MKMIIIGTDHTLQVSDGLKALIAEIVESEQVALIGEEYPADSLTAARQVAESGGIFRIQIDMNAEQRIKAGVDVDNKPITYDSERGRLIYRYFLKEDGMREEFWLDRIEAEMKRIEADPERVKLAPQTDGTSLVVCGSFHVNYLSEKAERRGHVTAKRWHPPELSELQPEELWAS
jgi:hypothetical protein